MLSTTNGDDGEEKEEQKEYIQVPPNPCFEIWCIENSTQGCSHGSFKQFQPAMPLTLKTYSSIQTCTTKQRFSPQHVYIQKNLSVERETGAWLVHCFFEERELSTLPVNRFPQISSECTSVNNPSKCSVAKCHASVRVRIMRTLQKNSQNGDAMLCDVKKKREAFEEKVSDKCPIILLKLGNSLNYSKFPNLVVYVIFSWESHS